jgi:hypothetical protein
VVIGKGSEVTGDRYVLDGIANADLSFKEIWFKK